jgi:hypothetical protein
LDFREEFPDGYKKERKAEVLLPFLRVCTLFVKVVTKFWPAP